MELSSKWNKIKANAFARKTDGGILRPADVNAEMLALVTANKENSGGDTQCVAANALSPQDNLQEELLELL